MPAEDKISRFSSLSSSKEKESKVSHLNRYCIAHEFFLYFIRSLNEYLFEKAINPCARKFFSTNSFHWKRSFDFIRNVYIMRTGYIQLVHNLDNTILSNCFRRTLPDGVLGKVSTNLTPPLSHFCGDKFAKRKIVVNFALCSNHSRLKTHFSRNPQFLQRSRSGLVASLPRPSATLRSPRRVYPPQPRP